MYRFHISGLGNPGTDSLTKMYFMCSILFTKKVREKSRKCHNHKPQSFPDTKRKRKQTKQNKRKLLLLFIICICAMQLNPPTGCDRLCEQVHALFVTYRQIDKKVNKMDKHVLHRLEPLKNVFFIYIFFFSSWQRPISCSE